MSTPTLTDAELKEAWDVFVENHQSITRTMNASGLTKGQLEYRLRRYKQKFGDSTKEASSFTIPDLPESDVEFEEVITKTLIPRSMRRIEHEGSKRWFEIKMKSDEPFIYLVLGDVHLDDDYCHWQLLYEHVKLVAERDDVLCLPIGDYHNNWIGRLNALYAKQDMSRSTAYKGIEWFLREIGDSTPVLVLGNHDDWNDGGERIKEMAGDFPMFVLDWRAQFKMVFPNGRELWIDAAHDHKGNSQYNELHAQKKAMLWGRTVHAAIAGHRHHPAIQKVWFPEEEMETWLLRAGAYKWYDGHARRFGFAEYCAAPALALIVDPNTDSINPIVHVSDDIDLSITLLEAMKTKRKKSKKKE